MEEAQILFLPATGTDGPTISTTVKNGHYQFEAKGGLREGKYVVSVSVGKKPLREDLLKKKPINAQRVFECERVIKRDDPRIDIELNDTNQVLLERSFSLNQSVSV